MTLEAILTTLVAIWAGFAGVFLASKYAERKHLSAGASDALVFAGFIVPAVGAITVFIVLSAEGISPLVLIFERVPGVFPG